MLGNKLEVLKAYAKEHGGTIAGIKSGEKFIYTEEIEMKKLIVMMKKAYKNNMLSPEEIAQLDELGFEKPTTAFKPENGVGL